MRLSFESSNGAWKSILEKSIGFVDGGSASDSSDDILWNDISEMRPAVAQFRHCYIELLLIVGLIRISMSLL
jgi:hypothetical protein